MYRQVLLADPEPLHFWSQGRQTELADSRFSDMSILPIYTFDHAVLRQETSQIEQDSSLLQTLIDDMIATMRNADGIGLAANQIGKSLALTVIDTEHIEGMEGQAALVLINPVITGTHGESVFEEGCLSLPGIREDIVRPDSIGVKFLDRKLQPIEMEADTILARVIQHEIDHLHGKYFTDYLSPFKLSLLRGKLSRMMKGEIETDYPLAPPSAHAMKARHAARKLPRM
jgi:peptide deformylase